MQVGRYPEDFDCYRRAENMPDPTEQCPISARRTLQADIENPAAEAAASASAGMAAIAALLQDEDTELAKVRLPCSL